MQSKFGVFGFILGLSITYSPITRANEVEIAAKIAQTIEKLSKERSLVVPVGKAREVEAKAAKVIESKQYDLLAPPKFASKLQVIEDADVLNKVKSNLADRLHAIWQDGAIKSGKTERLKVMKVDGQAIRDQAALESYLEKKNIPAELRKNFKLMDDGKGNIVAQEDILKLPNRLLAPNNAAENSISATIAVEFLHRWKKAGGVIDETFMHHLSDFIHEQWLVRNGGWASAEQKLPFNELSKVEAKKDVDIVNEALISYEKAASTTEELTRKFHKLEKKLSNLGLSPKSKNNPAIKEADDRIIKDSQSNPQQIQIKPGSGAVKQ